MTKRKNLIKHRICKSICAEDYKGSATMNSQSDIFTNGSYINLGQGKVLWEGHHFTFLNTLFGWISCLAGLNWYHVFPVTQNPQNTTVSLKTNWIWANFFIICSSCVGKWYKSNHVAFVCPYFRTVHSDLEDRGLRVGLLCSHLLLCRAYCQGGKFSFPHTSGCALGIKWLLKLFSWMWFNLTCC